MLDIPYPGLFFFAFIGAPAIVMVVAYVGVRLLEWDDDRRRARESSDP